MKATIATSITTVKNSETHSQQEEVRRSAAARSAASKSWPNAVEQREEQQPEADEDEPVRGADQRPLEHPGVAERLLEHRHGAGARAVGAGCRLADLDHADDDRGSPGRTARCRPRRWPARRRWRRSAGCRESDSSGPWCSSAPAGRPREPMGRSAPSVTGVETMILLAGNFAARGPLRRPAPWAVRPAQPRTRPAGERLTSTITRCLAAVGRSRCTSSRAGCTAARRRSITARVVMPGRTSVRNVAHALGAAPGLRHESGATPSARSHICR